MDLDIKKLTLQERYELIGTLIEEIKLRKYSYQPNYLEFTKRNTEIDEFLKINVENQNYCRN